MQADRGNPSVCTPDRAATARERCLRYLTFACYGSRLHGDESGSVDRQHNLVGSPLLAPNTERATAERRETLQDPYVLDPSGRTVVSASIQRHCSQRNWNLLVPIVRSNHVHVIVNAEARPERMMNEFKSYASWELNRLGRDAAIRRRWARHGSTRWLWRDEGVRPALQYVFEEQGEPMALYVAEERWQYCHPLPCGRGAVGEHALVSVVCRALPPAAASIRRLVRYQACAFLPMGSAARNWKRLRLPTTSAR